MNVSFVLLSTQRSGSTWVIDMLNSHPLVAAYSELFLEGGRGHPTFGGARDRVFWEQHLVDARARGEERPLGAELEAYLDQLFAPRTLVAAIGFKLMYGQLGARPELWDYALAKRVVIVHLVRRNLLDTLLSRATAVARDVHHAFEGVEPMRVELDPARLCGELERLEREIDAARERIARAGLRSCEVAYEDLAADALGFARLFEFLGVGPPPCAPRSALRKLNALPQAALIANHDRVRRALADTKFSALLR